MLDIGLSSSRGKTIAIADIGSGSVAFAIIFSPEYGPARVFAAQRGVLSFEERTTEAMITALAQQLGDIGSKAISTYVAEQKTGSFDALYCIIRAPWSRTRGVSAYQELPQPVEVTQGMVGTLAKQALASENELDKKALLEGAVIKVELNGYETGKPEGKIAQTIKVCALVSDCDTALRSAVEQKLQALLPQLKPRYRSSTRALLSAVRDLPNAAEDRVVVEIGSEGTNITIIRDTVVAGQHLIKEGAREIVSQLAPAGVPEETLSLVRMLGRDECSTAACEEMRAAIGKLEPELVRVFGEGLTASATPARLPNKLVLIAHPDLLPWLSKFFTRIDFTQFTTTTQPFEVETLDLAQLSQRVSVTSGVSVDPAVALSIALVNREEGR